MEENIKILIIEDNVERASELQKYLNKAGFYNIRHYKDFSEGEDSFLYEKFDLAIVDVKDDSPGGNSYAGVDIISKVMHNIFIPVIFWTGNSFKPIQDHLTEQGINTNLEDNMVSLVSKTETAAIPSKVQEIMKSKYFGVTKSIEHEISKTLAEHLWKHVRPHYNDYFSGVAKEDISRLQESILRSRVVRKLSAEIDNDTDISGYAAWRYIFPPVSCDLSTGSILTNKESSEWSIVLSPACNLEPRGKEGSAHVPKSDYLIVAKAKPVEEYNFYAKYSESPSKSAWNKLVGDKLKAKENWYYLPKFVDIPDLFINLENICAVQLNKEEYINSFQEGNSCSYWEYFAETNSLEHIATLSSPYVENLISQYSHFVGKVGTPDLRIMNIMKHVDNK